ncbi:outer membrane protein assembly factor BamD [Nonlabens tegetincola]|uniref:outer membrane protein assembly factor BamD n=1 Tax=Nonlabens tegetincola TaxID=323273 RepID=UPI000CF56816|nr:outer membrane protein assembly factor BamD [Nonlabens tegetincola]PQJ13909.1 outer membrane protein assembly factor BamD [Nonlabens tegetincola]PQJ17279.1 outer membrane protein assembly factor BamD [Nonlabens tegetincola]PQJ20986.1 outer membrane protein assembly factor BamD [Nonlabens tegetincola]
MKQIVLIFFIFLVLVSCGPYQKALKSDDPNVKVSMIDTLMKKEKYSKSIDLFEQIIPLYRGTDSAAPMAIKYAKALYGDRRYLSSAYQFERFVTSHPLDNNVEEAIFLGAKSYYHMSPVYSKDQSETNTALVKLQDYINAYPEGKYNEEANVLVAELREKLDRKAYEIAKQYHHRGGIYIKAAIAGFENFIIDHPGSNYLDDAHYYLFESQYIYAVNSFENLIPERLALAKKYYNNFARRFPNSEYKEDAQEIMAEIEKFESENLSN